MEDSEQQKTETNEKLGHSLEENLHQSTELKNQVDMDMFQPEEQMQEQLVNKLAVAPELQQPTHEENNLDMESVEQLVHESVQQLLEKALQEPLIQDQEEEKSCSVMQNKEKEPENNELDSSYPIEEQNVESTVNESSKEQIMYADQMEQETLKTDTNLVNLDSVNNQIPNEISSTSIVETIRIENDIQTVSVNNVANTNEEVSDQSNENQNELPKTNQMEQQQLEEIALTSSAPSSPSIQPPPPPMASFQDQIRMNESRDESQAETIESSAEDDENENSAVNAVLAAVEQASAEKAIDPLNNSNVTAKVVKKKPKNITPNKGSSNFEHLSSSPSSAQKRRKKDPSAPKAPLNGYLVYFNEERADMRQKNPTMSFGELTKIIAIKWKDLPTEDKQKYINEAELDKERYVKEMADYKKSDSYKQYLKETSNAKMARNEEAHHFTSGMKTDKFDSNGFMNSASNSQGHSINSLQHEVNVAGFDIPIFTEEFIEHSRNREHEMRQIRKEINELEQQNNVLHKHIENMKQSTIKVESDIEKYQTTNDKIHKSLDIFRQTILNCFGNLPLPNTQEYPSPANIDDYIMKLYSILANNTQNQQNDTHAFRMHIKSTLSKINFNSLFDSI